MSEILIDIRIEPLDEGGYLATSDELEGLVAQGRTVAETMEIAQDVARKLLESYREHGDPLPVKINAAMKSKRKRTTVRIPVGIEAEPTHL
jgi:antitoxin HicB